MLKKKNILFIESGTSGGGSFESLLLHVKSLNQKIFYPIILCFNQTKYIDLWEELGIEVIQIYDHLYTQKNQSILSVIYKRLYGVLWRISSRLVIFFVKHLAQKLTITRISRIVEENDIDLIYLNDQIMRDLFGVFVVERTQVKCISHLRSLRSKGFGGRIADYVNPRVDLFIANSRKCRQHWCDLGLNQKKTVVIYNALSSLTQQSDPTWSIRGRFDIAERFTHILGCIANFDKAKGHSFLLKSFARLYEQHKNYSLLLVGDGPLRQRSKTLVQEYGLSEAVRFAGYLNPVQDIIGRLDLLIVPSQSEAFGRTIIESMQVKTPVVATKVGGIPELITHEVNGLLVAYGDEEGLVQAILRLTGDAELKERIVEEAYRSGKERFSIERYAREMDTVYTSLFAEEPYLRTKAKRDIQEYASQFFHKNVWSS